MRNDHQATWLETITLLVCWLAAGLCGLFATLILYRVYNQP